MRLSEAYYADCGITLFRRLGASVNRRPGARPLFQQRLDSLQDAQPHNSPAKVARLKHEPILTWKQALLRPNRSLAA